MQAVEPGFRTRVHPTVPPPRPPSSRLQRIYAITFPDDKELKDYQHRMEEAKKRDHRNVGTQQELFFFHPLSPGSCFFLPHGARVYNAMVEFMREKYWQYDYEEVSASSLNPKNRWACCGRVRWARSCYARSSATARRPGLHLLSTVSLPTLPSHSYPQVVTPNIFNFDLWKTSGHADHYR